MKKRPEVWKNGVRTIGVRDERGEFARGHGSSGWTFEIWSTKRGTMVKTVLRNENGTLRGSTNYPLA